jgi:hypothetical protein
MRLLRSARWLFLALLISLVSASSYAGVFISVGFAPPVLPVYEQPPCPEPGLMWTPGYWAYGDEGYFWVPGAWVPAPYEGALWTPPYWGWSGGMFLFHEGYWGPHVGYYGGVNYGFGYMGIGFVGGMWRGHDFVYNRAVMRVDDRYIHNTYEDRAVVDRYTVARNSRVAYSGGPGGIQHQAGPEEMAAMREQHVARTSFQAQHETAARSDRSTYFKNNGGRPSTLAVSRPLPAETHSAPNGMRQGQQGSFGNRPGANAPGMQNRPNQQAAPTYQNRPNQQAAPTYQNRPNQQAAPTNQNRPNQQVAPTYQNRPNQQSRPAPVQQNQQRTSPSAQSKPAQQARPAPAPKAQQTKPAPREPKER